MSANDDSFRNTGGRGRRTGEGLSQPRRKSDDKPARQDDSGGRPNNRPADRSGDRPGDRFDNRRPSRPGDRSDDRSERSSGGRTGDNRGDRRNDRPADRSGDRYDDRRPSRPGERRSSRPGDRHDDRPGDRSGDRRPSRPGERRDDRRNDRPGDRRNDRPGDRRNDRPGERRDDRRNDRPGERRDDRPGERRSPNAPRDRYGRPALRPEKREGDRAFVPGQRSAERNAERPRYTPRPFEVGAWPAAKALFPPLTAEALRILDMLPEALAKVWPLNSAHRRTLPDDVAQLSRLLTTERAGLDRPYWSSPASISAYLYYFLPWNLVRLTRVLASLPLPDPRSVAPQGGEALLVDVGSGPLTLPLALWLAKPEWRSAPLRVLALDTSSQPLELGKTLMEVLGELTGQPVWPVRVARAPLEHAVRQIAPLLSGGKVRPWLVSAANVLNELRFGKKRARGGSAIEEEDEFDSLDNEAVDFDGNPDAEGAEADKPEGCREDKLDSFLESLSPLFNHVGGADAPAAVGPSLLFVEPGTRLGGSTIMRLRQLAVDGGLTALSPCTHQLDCPLLRGQGGRTWCHFTFGSEGAPLWLEDISLAAGLGKNSLSLSPLLLAALPEAAPETGNPLPARVLSAPFVVPGLAGRARYACSSKGMLLLENAEALASGDSLAVTVVAGAPRDRKSGALLVSPPARPGAESVLTRRPDSQDGQNGQNGQDRRDGRDFRDGRDARDNREGREGRDNRDSREGRDNRDNRDNRGQRPAPYRKDGDRKDGDRPAGRGQSDRPARAPHGERSQRDDRNGQGGRPPRPQGNDRPRRDDKQGRPDRPDRQDRQDRPDRQDRNGRQDRQDRNSRGDQNRGPGRDRDGGQSRGPGRGRDGGQSRGPSRDKNGSRGGGQNKRSGPRGGKP